MAFEIIKRFLALIALIKRFTGSGTKFADSPGAVRMAMRALHGFFGKQRGIANLLFGIGRRYTIGLQFFFTCLAHPVGGPGRRKNCSNFYVLIPLFQQGHADAHANDIHGWASGIGRCDHNFGLPPTPSGGGGDIDGANDT